MLPLRPPASTPDPGYPERSRIFSNVALRGRITALLAAPGLALVLGGCGETASPQTTPAGGVTAVPSSATAAEPQVELGRIATPQQAEPLPLPGEPAPIPPPPPPPPAR